MAGQKGERSHLIESIVTVAIMNVSLLGLLAMLFSAALERAASIATIYPMGYLECNRAC